MNKQLPFPHQKKKSLKKFSTFGIGGPARYFSEARSIEQMQQMLAYADQVQLPICILGKGSNALFDDRGFNGLVILNRIDFLRSDLEKGLFCAGSGYSFARLGKQTARLGWTGLEFASGIPATVGGALFMNAGAMGQQTCDSLVAVKYVNEKGELEHLLKAELEFGYRTSSFQHRQGAIVEGRFKLAPSKTAKSAQNTLLSARLQTQPYGEKSAGCAFRNPALKPAGKLIEECGLKGQSVGGAQISLKHANFIVNQGGASAENVLGLIQKIKEQIHQKTGILLEEEIRYIPYE
ncbi:MAG: UDP-N-acetylenolpyruvoylglucosamine reductase [Chlamydiales bacterium]|nr:UDP-N-acetylenolpyruvoylglucosamine reductase [Chlamydiales bacterium]